MAVVGDDSIDRGRDPAYERCIDHPTESPTPPATGHERRGHCGMTAPGCAPRSGPECRSPSGVEGEATRRTPLDSQRLERDDPVVLRRPAPHQVSGESCADAAIGVVDEVPGGWFVVRHVRLLRPDRVAPTVTASASRPTEPWAPSPPGALGCCGCNKDSMRPCRMTSR